MQRERAGRSRRTRRQDVVHEQHGASHSPRRDEDAVRRTPARRCRHRLRRPGEPKAASQMAVGPGESKVFRQGPPDFRGRIEAPSEPRPWIRRNPDDRGHASGDPARAHRGGELASEWDEELRPARELRAQQEASRDVVVDERGGHRLEGQRTDAAPGADVARHTDRQRASVTGGTTRRAQARPAGRAAPEMLDRRQGPLADEATGREEVDGDPVPRLPEGRRHVAPKGGGDLSCARCTPERGRAPAPRTRSLRGNRPRSYSSFRTPRIAAPSRRASSRTPCSGTRAGRAPSP